MIHDHHHSRLATCPASPNCVSSDAADARHYIQPLRLAVPAAEAWSVVKDIVADLPRTQIIFEGDHSLHMECRSRIFRFVDDLELQLRPEENQIAVRSAARLGYSDLGVNRRRVETLRAQLIQRGIIAAI